MAGGGVGGNKVRQNTAEISRSKVLQQFPESPGRQYEQQEPDLTQAHDTLGRAIATAAT